MKIHKKKMVNLLVMTKNKKNIDKDRYYIITSLLLRNGKQDCLWCKRSRDFVLWAVFFYHIVSMVVKIELEVRMAVKIVRVLNTNAVVSSDQEGRELIITGAGIGFKKKKGENLDEALADKTYYLESVDDSRRLQEVVKEISEEYLEIVSRIVKTAREEGLKVRDSLYVTLTDHINSAVDRYRENIALKNMMKLEIRKFYPKEYEIGLRAVQ